MSPTTENLIAIVDEKGEARFLSLTRKFIIVLIPNSKTVNYPR